MPSRIFIAREKSVFGYEASKDRLTLLLGANATSNFKLKSVFIYHSKNLSTLKNYVQSPLLVPHQLNNKASMTACLQHGLLNIFSPLLRSQKRFLSKFYCSLTVHLVTQELWQRCTTRLMFSCLLTHTSILQPMVQEFSSLKKYTS